MEISCDASKAGLISPACPFFTRAASVGVQSVLFNNSADSIWRAAASLSRSAELGVHSGVLREVSLHLGDSSPLPCISEADLTRIRDEFNETLRIEYTCFNANLGSAAGHNRLAQGNNADFIFVQNPDIIMAPRVLEMLLAVFRTPGVGMVEAKQLPMEHPKDYDSTTGETLWATGACVLIPASLFRHLGGFDSYSFFLYCDDVDLSWRARLAGYRIIFQPAAVVFHDKRLSKEGKWMPSSAERYYSAEASLFLAHKWSRPDLVDQYLRIFESSEDENLRKAHEVFVQKREQGKLPPSLDPEHAVGRFIGHMYAKHRFSL